MARVAPHVGVGDADPRLDQSLQLFKPAELVRLARDHRVQIELASGPTAFRRFCADVRFPAFGRMVVMMVMPMIVVAARAMFVMMVVMIMVMVVMIMVVMIVTTVRAMNMFVFMRMLVTLFMPMAAARAMNVRWFMFVVVFATLPMSMIVSVAMVVLAAGTMNALAQFVFMLMRAARAVFMFMRRSDLGLPCFFLI
jgi:hypothetical protein